METRRQIISQKQVLLRAYDQLWPLEQAIKVMMDYDNKLLQISVLGKLGEDCIAFNNIMIRSIKDLKAYWKSSLGSDTDFGLFCNPDIGTIFIAGPLVSLFLHDLDGKKLGAMSAGPYGILRGLGIVEEEAVAQIQRLHEGCYLCIVRGNRPDLARLDSQLASA